MAIFVVLFVLLLLNINYISCIDVNTTSGVVRGQTITVDNPSGRQSINQFLGIPFAEPPVGDLRFAKPVPIKQPSKDIIDATKPKASCWQNAKTKRNDLLTLNEDCLLLNVWTQNATKQLESELKPVMFWIYGGSLSSGSIFMDTFNGSVLATHDVVIVTTNYRLGQFGFLYGDRDDAPGNVGLFDQLLALKWVRENIHSFGGDRDQITIFGESAGSWSVSAHILSPQSKGLFKRAIMESGAHMYNKDRDILSKSEALASAKYLAKQLNCSETVDWVKCLRQVDAKSLTKYTSYLTYPVLGTEFLPISASKAFQDKVFNTDIDLMAGVVRNEGSGFVKTLITHPDKITLDEFKFAIKLLDNLYHNLDQQKLIDFYLKGVDTNNSTALRWALSDLTGDMALKCPTYLFAKTVATVMNKSQNVYFYEVLYESKYHANKTGCDEKTMGICHAQEVPFVFGMPFIHKEEYEPKDRHFSQDIMNWWTKFAKYGHQDNEWPLLLNNPDKPVVKGLDPTNVSLLLNDPFHDTCDGIWKTYYLG